MLGATNDNILRWLVIGIGKQFVEPRHYGAVLTSGTICFVVPYLLLAAPAGFLADRYSKRKVIVACKVVEIFIMLAAVVAIWWGSLEALFVVVALMARVHCSGRLSWAAYRKCCPNRAFLQPTVWLD